MISEIKWEAVNVRALLKENSNFTYEPNYFFTKDIRFSDNKWDFRNLDKLHNNGSIYKFDFNEIKSTIFRTLLKKLVIREMFLFRNRIPTIKQFVFDQIKRLILYFENEKKIFVPEYISVSVINNYIQVVFEHLSVRTRQWFLSAFRKFFNELEFAGIDLDFRAFEPILNSVDRRQVRAQIEANKIASIPEVLQKNIMKYAEIDMNNSQLSAIHRMTACMIVILLQTGMRGGELSLLESNRLKEISILGGKKKVTYLEFITYKTTVSSDGKWTETIAYKETINAYQMLEKITKKTRIECNTPYLFISVHSNGNNKRGRRYTYQTFGRNLNVFFYRYQKELRFDKLSSYERSQVAEKYIDKSTCKGSSYIKKEDIGKTFFIIRPHQFRVAIANTLNKKGVKLQWIRKHMNHLEEDMTKHYFRDDELLKKVFFNGSSPDGSRLESTGNQNTISKPLETEMEDAYNVVNKFLKKKKLNIFKDIDEIIDTLQNNPLRDTSVGLCLKAMGSICERQERLETLEKWYYISPQIVDIASFDFTYKRFIDKAKIVRHNRRLAEEDLKYERQYQIEYIALKKFFINCFSLEFKKLLNEIENNGTSQVISTYPHLEEVVSKIPEVENEVEEWIDQLKLKN